MTGGDIVHVHPPQAWRKCPSCTNPFHGAENSVCLNCKIHASGDKGFWRSIAREDRIDNRDARANAAAERVEIREREDEEAAAEWGAEIWEGSDGLL